MRKSSQFKENTTPSAADYLFVSMAALMDACREPVGKWVKTNPTLLHTRNLFGPPEEIAGKTLRLIERNDQGDCLCVFDGKAGTNIVDIDHRDIAPNEKADLPPTGARQPRSGTETTNGG
jgi:hypothetical protein